MSISSYTTVTMLDSRPAQITISVPKSTDITNRIITFKDLYGSASISTITLVTRSGDTFEDGTFSTIMSNAYQTVNLYAGQPGKWLNVGATGGGGGDSAGLTTVSNLLNAVSTNATNISTNLNTVSNVLTGVSTTVVAGRFPGISTNTISTSLIRAGYISSPQGYISSLIVDSLSFSLSNSFIVMGDIITTSVSTIQTFTSSLTTNNLRVGTVSTLNYIAFSGLQQGYAQTVIAEQATATGIQELLVFKGSTNTDRIRMQTTGPIVFEPGVSARVFPNTSSNATPAMIITTSSNVGIGVAAPTVALDVAGAGRFTAVSTNTISTNNLYVGTTAAINFGGGNVTSVGTYYASDRDITMTAVGYNLNLNATTAAKAISLTSPSINLVGSVGITSGDLYMNYKTITQASTINFGNGASITTTTGPSQLSLQGTGAGGYVGMYNAYGYVQVAGNGVYLGTNGFDSIYLQNDSIFASNISQTAGNTRLPALSTNTISTNSITAGENLDLTATSINLHTSSIQQYLNYVPVAQPVIQFGSWSAGAANTDGTGGPETIPITDYNNTTYCIYVTGKYIATSAVYTAVPVDGSNFNVYFANGDPYGSNVFYWQTMGYYGASAGPGQGSGGGGGGHT